MNKELLFKQAVTFFSAIHSKTFELTKDIQLEDLTKIQYSILELLMFEPRKTPSEINSCLHLSMPNTSRELRKLEQKGFIKKYNDAFDKRKVFIELSELGHSIMNDAFSQIKVKFFASLKDISEQDINDISHAIKILQKKLLQSNDE